MQQAFVGIDVGTSSARAGIFDENGSLLATARHPITVWHEAGSVVEQSSSEIWAACAASVRAAMAEAALPASAVKGIGFDATCSLVVRGRRRPPADGQYVRRRHGETSSSGWTIARLPKPAGSTRSRDDVLRYVGGSISPEMEIPKLLWLKRHLPSTYQLGRSFLRPRRLSFVSRHRVDGAFDVHAGVQVELSRPRTALERQLFRAHRSWRSCLGRICENRQARSSRPARRWAPA